MTRHDGGGGFEHSTVATLVSYVALITGGRQQDFHLVGILGAVGFYCILGTTSGFIVQGSKVRRGIRQSRLSVPPVRHQRWEGGGEKRRVEKKKYDNHAAHDNWHLKQLSFLSSPCDELSGSFTCCNSKSSQQVPLL